MLSILSFLLLKQENLCIGLMAMQGVRKLSDNNTLTLKCLKPNSVSRELSLPEVVYQDHTWAITNDLRESVERRGGAVWATFIEVPWRYERRQVNFLNYVAKMVVRTNRGNVFLGSGGMSRLEHMMRDVAPDPEIRQAVFRITQNIWRSVDPPSCFPCNLRYEKEDDLEHFGIRSAKGTMIQWSHGGSPEGSALGCLELDFENPSTDHFCQIINQLGCFPEEARFAEPNQE